MPCTTLLVGKLASADGSTLIARNSDSGAGSYTPKKFVAVLPQDQPRSYTSVISKVTIELPDDPMPYACVPNAMKDEGEWASAGINAANVAMTATETITSNPRVQGADPLVKGGIGEEDLVTIVLPYVRTAKEGCLRLGSLLEQYGTYEMNGIGDPLVKGGIGEEDLVTIVLPYVRTAKEGCLRLGSLLEQYGTYEMNGIGFCDGKDVWWLETIGGHHWMARRLPDDAYAVIPNQLGLDFFDFSDPENFIGSADLETFVKDNSLDLRMDPEEPFNPRDAFGSHDDSDHTYNTPRAWWVLKELNPNSFAWTGPEADFTPDSNDLPWCLVPEKKITVEDVKYILSGHYQGTPFDPYLHHGPEADFTPDSNDLPWCLVPEKKITVEDVKYILSGHYQGTPFDPYLHHGDTSMAGAFRTIGINRTDYLGCCQVKTDAPSILWLAYASNPFNVMVPFYTDITDTPAYVRDTTEAVSTDSFYWTSRMIAAMADACDRESAIFIERYQNTVGGRCRRILNEYTPQIQSAADEGKAVQLCMDACDRESAIFIERYQNTVGGRCRRILNEYTPQIQSAADEGKAVQLCMEANDKVAAVTKEEAEKCLGEVLKALSNRMKNAFSRSDA